MQDRVHVLDLLDGIQRAAREDAAVGDLRCSSRLLQRCAVDAHHRHRRHRLRLDRVDATFFGSLDAALVS
jgi:hypothetical protein